VFIAKEILKLTLPKRSGHVQDIISTIQPHDSPERFESLGVEVIFLAVVGYRSATFKVNGEILKLEPLCSFHRFPCSNSADSGLQRSRLSDE